MKKLTRKQQNRISYALVGLTVLIASLLIIFNFERIKVALTPQPETFTELYFEDHLELPSQVYSGVPFNVAFTVHNLEHQTMDYPFEIYIPHATDSAQDLLIYNDNFSLEHDASKTVNLKLTLPELNYEKYQIVVNLINLDQTIHFWFDIATPSAEILNAANSQE